MNDVVVIKNNTFVVSGYVNAKQTFTNETELNCIVDAFFTNYPYKEIEFYKKPGEKKKNIKLGYFNGNGNYNCKLVVIKSKTAIVHEELVRIGYTYTNISKYKKNQKLLKQY